MKIKLDGETLRATLKSLSGLIGSSSISFEVTKNFLKLYSTNAGNSCLMTVPCEIVSKSDGSKFAIDSNAFAAAVANRKEVNLEVTIASVIITSSRYKAELLIHEFDAVPVVPADVKQNGIPLKKDFIKTLDAVTSKLALTPLLATYDYVPFGIKSTKKGTFIASYDYYQAAFFFDAELTGNFEFVLPSGIFTAISRELKGQDYSIIANPNTIYAFNDNFEYAAAVPDNAVNEVNKVSFSDMRTLYDSLSTFKGTSFKLKTEGMLSLLENGKAIYEKDSTFSFDIRDDQCRLDLRSSSGKMSTVIKLASPVKKPLKFNCDFHFFSTLLKKAGSSMTLLVVPDRMMLFRNEPVTYMMSLS